MDDTMTMDDRALLAKAKMIGRLAEEVETGAAALGRLREMLDPATDVRLGIDYGISIDAANVTSAPVTEERWEPEPVAPPSGSQAPRLPGESTKQSVHRLRATGLTGVRIAEILGISRQMAYFHMGDYKKPPKEKRFTPAPAIAEPPEEQPGELDEALDNLPDQTYWQCTMCDRKHFTAERPESCAGCLETALVQKAA